MQSHVAANVRAELARKNKRQEHLADLLGFTRQAVSQRLLGRVDFRVAELQAIADYLEVPISALVGDSKASA
ncbi:helix-turn-helix transcriptional regulator [Mycobacterium marinum]|uniref:helix-turn-helix transcriptional regulator n=1 Tax=Mycobacterium marinum TaxID=1781 RepID=UPI0035652E21